MTASEAIKIINGIEEVRGELPEDGEDVEIALMMAKDALEEVEQYRAIGTIERFRELTENNNRIIEILRTHRFTDEECIEEIAKIVGVYSQRLEYKGKSVGKWVFKNDGAYGKRRAYCSACGKRSGIGGIESNQKKPFCPNCGAKMQE